MNNKSIAVVAVLAIPVIVATVVFVNNPEVFRAGSDNVAISLPVTEVITDIAGAKSTGLKSADAKQSSSNLAAQKAEEKISDSLNRTTLSDEELLSTASVAIGGDPQLESPFEFDAEFADRAAQLLALAEDTSSSAETSGDIDIDEARPSGQDLVGGERFNLASQGMPSVLPALPSPTAVVVSSLAPSKAATVATQRKTTFSQQLKKHPEREQLNQRRARLNAN